jgi:hypothetical protein
MLKKTGYLLETKYKIIDASLVERRVATFFSAREPDRNTPFAGKYPLNAAG